MVILIFTTLAQTKPLHWHNKPALALSLMPFSLLFHVVTVHSVWGYLFDRDGLNESINLFQLKLNDGRLSRRDKGTNSSQQWIKQSAGKKNVKSDRMSVFLFQHFQEDQRDLDSKLWSCKMNRKLFSSNINDAMNITLSISYQGWWVIQKNGYLDISADINVSLLRSWHNEQWNLNV